MLLAAMVYWLGRAYLPDEKPSKTETADTPQISTAQWRTVALLFAVLALTVLQSISVDQFYNVGLIYIAQSVDLNTPFGAIPAGWFISINSLGYVLAAPFLISLWKVQAKRGTEPNDFTKMAIGALIIGASSVFMAMSSMQLETGNTGSLLPVVAFFLMGVGFMWYWPTLLAIVARYSPDAIKARTMAMVYLTVFALVGGAVFLASGTSFKRFLESPSVESITQVST
jgi:POT family proton-dependent oligopeptide transporter